MLNLNTLKSVFIKIDKNLLLSVVAISAVAGTLALMYMGPGNPSVKTVAESSIDYLNKNVLTQGGQTASLVSYAKENGVIKLKMKVGGQEYDSYVTLNGRLFFPEGLNLTATSVTQPAGNNQAGNPPPQTPANLTKVDKPMLEAYVVSMCPFGLQFNRMADNAIANIPALADHVKIRYIGSVVNGAITAMHGEKEAKENGNQICIREEQPDKFWAYLSCFGKAGDSASCLKSEKVDVAKLNACVADKNRMLKYAQADFDLNTKYQIQGSPTVVLNGQKASEFDFGGRTSDAIRKMICDSSTNPGSYCSKTLNTEQAATSYSVTYAGAGSGANNAANCAPQ